MVAYCSRGPVSERRLRGHQLSLTLAIALLAGLAHAQTFSNDQRLLLSEGTLRGSPRLMGIAGAFVGLAEGAEGITRNPAAAAAKDPKFAGDFEFDFAAAMHFLPPWATREQDWDNDGRADQASAGPFEFLGTQVIYLVGSIQYKMIALGFGVDLQNFLNKTKLETEDFTRFHNVAQTHAFGTLAGRFWRDQLLIGIGVESTHSFIGYGEQKPGDWFPGLKDSMGFHGWGVQFGGVYRPEDADWRVGFSYKPALYAQPFRPRQDIGGLVAPSGVGVPGRLSLGGAFAFGWGRKLNITSKDGWVKKDEEKPDSPMTPAMMKFLLTAQLDIFFPVEGATVVGAFFGQTEAVPAGNQVSVQPRIALEKEVVADLLRLRVGGYFEPRMRPFGPLLRSHLTFGFEVALFKLGQERISFGLSFDIASMYQNLSVGFLVWK